MKTRGQLPFLPYPPGMFTSRVINPHPVTGGGGGGSTLLTDLLHWWDLDEASGNAIDATGNQDLTESGTVGQDATGAPDGGAARSFDGFNTGDYFSTGAGNIWNSGSATTIALWMKVASGNSTVSGVYGHNAPNGYSDLFINAVDGKPYWWFDAGFNGAINTDSRGNWHCVTITSTGPGGSDTFYLDGSSADTGTAGWEPGSATFYLGNRYNGSIYTFNGLMCSVAIWDRVLTGDEITEFYNGGTNLRYADL